MTVLALDTHKIVKRLKDTGFSEAQAETVTDILVDVSETSTKSAATKGDLNELGLALKSDFNGLKSEFNGLRAEFKELKSSVRSDLNQLENKLRSEMQKEIAPLKTDIALLKWMIGTLIAGVAALIVKAFFG